MGAGDLTTLDHVKAWLNLEETTTSDPLLSRLITAASAFALSYMNRDGFALTEYVDTYDGYGSQFMVLRQFPVVSVSGVWACGSPILPATGDGMGTPFNNGWVLENQQASSAGQRLTLFGRRFPNGRGAVTIKYKTGYIRTETVTIEAGTVDTSATWIADESVVDQYGVPFDQVDSGPATGQYSVAAGTYTFSPDDIGRTALITYSYVPPDVEQAVWELVGERFKVKSRIGEVSHSLNGQQTVSFSQKSLSDYTRDLLDPYKRQAPI